MYIIVSFEYIPRTTELDKEALKAFHLKEKEVHNQNHYEAVIKTNFKLEFKEPPADMGSRLLIVNPVYRLNLHGK